MTRHAADVTPKRVDAAKLARELPSLSPATAHSTLDLLDELGRCGQMQGLDVSRLRGRVRGRPRAAHPFRRLRRVRATMTL